MSEVRPSVGWGVTHLMLRARPGAGGAEEALRALEAFAADEPQQVIAFSVLGGRADVGLMLLGPDLDAIDALAKRVLSGPFDVAYSFVSLTELSEYTSTEEEERARLEAEGADDVEAALAAWRTRMEAYHDARLHPRLPARAMIAFYPMSKRRVEGANWFTLPYDDRSELMHEHGASGRKFSGRILQLITGSTGLDDYEWGVTLFAQRIDDLKEVVYTMRFDRASALYAEFGPFYTGMVTTVDELMART